MHDCHCFDLHICVVLYHFTGNTNLDRAAQWLLELPQTLHISAALIELWG
jgi:hypothetical protein